ncbi:hypothetical protein GGG16DRAFT_95419 [Schizophyllum commune]
MSSRQSSSDKRVQTLAARRRQEANTGAVIAAQGKITRASAAAANGKPGWKDALPKPRTKRSAPISADAATTSSPASLKRPRTDSNVSSQGVSSRQARSKASPAAVRSVSERLKAVKQRAPLRTPAIEISDDEAGDDVVAPALARQTALRCRSDGDQDQHRSRAERVARDEDAYDEDAGVGSEDDINAAEEFPSWIDQLSPSAATGAPVHDHQPTPLPKEDRPQQSSGSHDQARAHEQPMWQPEPADQDGEDVMAAPPGGNPGGSGGPGDGGDHDDIPNISIQAPQGRELRVTDQHPAVQEWIGLCTDTIRGNAAFDDALLDNSASSPMLRDILCETAVALGLHGVDRQVREDLTICRLVERTLNMRISNWRGAFKRAAVSQVAGFYNFPLAASSESKAHASWLLDRNRFIFPLKANGEPDGTKAFGARAIASVIHDVIFKPGNDSFAVKHEHRFSSSITTAADELELPIPLVALAATAIGAAIEEWAASETTHVDIEFSISHIKSRYQSYEAILNGIKAANPQGFHHRMHALYTEASGNLGTRTNLDMNTEMEFIDIAGM